MREAPLISAAAAAPARASENGKASNERMVNPPIRESGSHPSLSSGSDPSRIRPNFVETLEARGLTPAPDPAWSERRRVRVASVTLTTERRSDAAAYRAVMED